MRTSTLVVVVLILVACASLVSAGTQVELSIHQHQRLEPVERFQVDTRIHLQHAAPAFRAGVEYSMFEAIHGPISDHTLNLFTFYWGRGPVTLTSLLVLDGSYDKENAYHDAVVEARANLRVNLPRAMSGWSLEWIPAIRVSGSEEWKPSVSLGASVSRSLGVSTLEVAVNSQSPRDRYLVAGSHTAATARIHVPLANETRFALEYGRLLGQIGPERHWWTWRLELAPILEF